MRKLVIFVFLVIAFNCYSQSWQTHTTEMIDGPTAYAGPDTTICIGDCLTLDSALATNYLGFYWATNGTGTFNEPHTLHPIYCPGPGDIQAGTVTLTLTVIGTDSFPYAIDSIVITIINCNTGINEAEKELQFKVYPNPSQGDIIIENPQKELIEIIDSSGRQFWANKFEISCEDRITLPRGLYFVTRVGNHNKLVTKLLVY
ncbi:MAG: T9SS type A sorting domain-containing protein [Bacteroidetes bacterium]|nr:T9SS type A sorting domain-containing protein [Bacteroidota bacterium]